MVVVVVLVGAVIAGVLLTSGGKKSATARAGRQAPDFTLPSLQDGKAPVSLASYKGTPVLVNFWATWCTPCVQEMPLLQAAHAKWGSKVQFVGIDRQDYKPDALRFADTTHVTYSLASDPDARSAHFRAERRYQALDQAADWYSPRCCPAPRFGR